MRVEKAAAVNVSAINFVGVAFAVLLGVQILLMPRYFNSPEFLLVELKR